MALFPGLPRWAGTRKVKPIWILLKQETLSGIGISWAVCKSAPHSRQITRPLSFLQVTEGTNSYMRKTGKIIFPTFCAINISSQLARSAGSCVWMHDRGNARAFIKDLERVRPTAIIGQWVLVLPEFLMHGVHASSIYCLNNANLLLQVAFEMHMIT